MILCKRKLNQTTKSVSGEIITYNSDNDEYGSNGDVGGA